LIDTKATDNSNLTLLHILIGIVRQQFPHILSFIDDLKDVPQAARSKLLFLNSKIFSYIFQPF
jgi:hypothetical protein